MVPSSDCMKKAMATTQGIQRAVTGSSGARLGMAFCLVLQGAIAGQARSHSLNPGGSGLAPR
ncbi:hypothetical protein D3C78_1681960 [compost metagenome]